jgi:hypothetical protein
VEARAERIAIFFLPGYAPELNPDELLNQDVTTCCSSATCSTRRSRAARSWWS